MDFMCFTKHSQKKKKAVTGAVPFQKVHICLLCLSRKDANKYLNKGAYYHIKCTYLYLKGTVTAFVTFFLKMKKCVFFCFFLFLFVFSVCVEWIHIHSVPNQTKFHLRRQLLYVDSLLSFGTEPITCFLSTDSFSEEWQFWWFLSQNLHVLLRRTSRKQ